MLDQLRELHPLLPASAGLLALLLVALIADLVAKRVLVGAIRALANTVLGDRTLNINEARPRSNGGGRGGGGRDRW